MSDAASPSSIEVRVAGARGLRPGECQRFVYERGSLTLEGFVLRHGEDLVAFANSCPHWSVDLDFGTGEFYDVALDRIVCRNHGALFHPRTGFCEWGPCTGRSLERFQLACDGEDALVTVPL